MDEQRDFPPSFNRRTGNLHCGCYITAETWSKGAPKIFFTQYDLDVERVVKLNEVHAFNMGVLPNVNPANLPNALKELTQDPDKKTKTISLNPNLDVVSYKAIQPGFWFAGVGEVGKMRAKFHLSPGGWSSTTTASTRRARPKTRCLSMSERSE